MAQWMPIKSLKNAKKLSYKILLHSCFILEPLLQPTHFITLYLQVFLEVDK